MSLNIPPVQPVKVIDPRLQINKEREYVALKGAQVNSWQVFPTTNLDISNVNITANPPSRRIVVSRHVLKKATFLITIQGTNTSGSNLLQPGYYAPRNMPLLAITNAENININNDTLTQSPMYQYWLALMWYHNDFLQRFGKNSISATMLDQSINYEDAVNTVRNPLAGMFDNSYEIPRGAYHGLEVVSNDPAATQAVLRLTVEEPIFLSPLVFDKYSDYACGFIGIENFTYSCTFSKPSRLLSLVQNQGLPGQISLNLSTIAVELEDFRLNFNYLTPDPIMPLPRQMTSSYYNIISYPTKWNTAIAPGAVQQIVMQSVQLSSIPRKIYAFVRRDDNDQTAGTADSYFALDTDSNPLVVTWNNNIFFSTATTSQLYEMSVKNGLGMSYQQFIATPNGLGSILCIEPGVDLGLASDESPGLLEKIQFGLQVNVRNTYSSSVAPTLYVVCVFEGVFNMVDGNTSHMLGVLSKSDVLDSVENPLVTYKKSESIFGGDFFSGLKRGLRGVHDFLKKGKVISNVASVVPHPYGQVASNVAKNLGYGTTGGELGGRLSSRDLRRLRE